MKRFLTMCAAALAVLALAEQQASAWTKSSFSVGLSYNREASDNSLCKGWLYTNGPHPSAQGGGDFGGYDGHGYDGHGFAGSEGVPFASMQYAPVMQQQPMLPAPRPMPIIEQRQQ